MCWFQQLVGKATGRWFLSVLFYVMLILVLIPAVSCKDTSTPTPTPTPTPQPATITVGNITLDMEQSGTAEVWVKNFPQSASGGLDTYTMNIYLDNTKVDVTGFGPGDATYWGLPNTRIDYSTYVRIGDVVNNYMCPGPRGIQSSAIYTSTVSEPGI